MTVTPEFEAAVRTAEEWIDDFVQRLGWHDRQRGYTVLLAAIHAFRDCLPREQAIYLGAQFPILLRGFYYEGWHPGAHPTAKSRSSFLERIHDSAHRDPGIDAEYVARTVFALLTARLPTAEIEEAKAATPSALHNLWPS